MSHSAKSPRRGNPSLLVSILPVALLIVCLVIIIINKGAGAVQDFSYAILLSAAGLSAVLAISTTRRKWTHLLRGIRKSARQILPAVPILLLIGTMSSTWILSGVVPAMISYGLQLLNPDVFLLMACIVCSVVSVLTGSSWTTIATLGVAMMGIGTVMGFSQAWVAGAIISGAYFGDKVSPLSDTTVLASSTCGVPLFTHIRFLMLTTIPSMTLALIVFAVVGFCTPTITAEHAMNMENAIAGTFVITPWLLVVPALTIALIVMRVHTVITLALSSIAGLITMFAVQPSIVATLTNQIGSVAGVVLTVLSTSTNILTGDALLDSLVETSGMQGMLPTVFLVLSAMTFGGTMLGSGMISTITQAITRPLHNGRKLVRVTVCTGLMFNSTTGDQYLSIILAGNIFRTAYKRLGIKPQVLSRALEDSVSVTSVLIPWNSCGMTQSAVLGVATLTYLPCCVFNYLSPLMSILMARLGYKILEKPQK